MSHLEQLFQQTQRHYNLIPDFIEQLLVADIYCIAQQNNANEIQFRVFETSEGEQAIPFFLTLAQIHQDIGIETEYILLKTKKLFEMTQGAILILNPTSTLHKVFQPEEIQIILDMHAT
ncbi:enhanced serine sensitivity protein SseB [Acinetobacter sp. ANC 4558]|uniref:SseB family protein n=1 Tax=Acinetobacter sp. ANC 4558 TaxID=1977876 RepID=UPI000A357384|nr:SseB family protein [Acinetobacter sp. ANC 4558]OTG87147.1 enhanced serine sensitivity protein SseB [Acinetobacter sp. ANC 4558]